MNRIRTIQGAADELRKRDPGCAISAHNIRQLVLHKEIPSRRRGSHTYLQPCPTRYNQTLPFYYPFLRH